MLGAGGGARGEFHRLRYRCRHARQQRHPHVVCRHVRRVCGVLGLTDLLLGVGIASTHVMQLTRSEMVWRLDCKTTSDKSGVAIVLEKQKVCEEAFGFGIVSPTDAADVGGGEAGGTTARWHEFYVTTVRARVRRRDGGEGLRIAAKFGRMATLRKLIGWAMVDVGSSDYVSETGRSNH